ncbi:hypothetical protein GCM10010172_49450 [Paractinoplanes ferrugineus]|uniref:Uncharacterized protein n=1 Tax=Paractinoplanes ferrugineus TaxID=113564 RepID=A0A919J9K1_9ACTN|nr:hypothetical protein Afe05nite_76320 [Actinoplanes ferrugineus]
MRLDTAQGQLCTRGKTVAIEVTGTDLTIHTDTGPQIIRRTNQQPVRSIEGHRPRKTKPS